MAKVSAGSYDLNRWLHGGYDSDVITTIYGGSGSGKTNFCLLVAISQAKKGNNVLYIDTEGGFSVERVRQIAGEEADLVLKHIFILKPTNFNEQKEAFKELLKYAKKSISLIVVDGMTMLYRLAFAEARQKSGDDVQKINAELAHQLGVLAEIARKQDIPIVITNQIYTWENGSRMVAGDILKYWSKCWIELVNENGRRTGYLRKHRSLGESNLGFVIVNEGVKKRGWL